MTIRNIIRRALCMLLPLAGLTVCTSCTESDDSVEEYVDWQKRNTEYFSQIHSTAQQAISAGSMKWKLIPTFSKTVGGNLAATDYVVVEVLEEGTGAGCPLYTDTTRVHYSCSILPSTSYPEGHIVDKSFNGSTLNTATDVPLKSAFNTCVDGWTTAVMKMHIGDRWRVYVPYNLGYGTTNRTNDYKDIVVPAYSTLIFDLTLAAYYHPGKPVPDWK